MICTRLPLPAILAGVLAIAGSANAGTLDYSYTGTVPDGHVTATADLTFGNNSLTIVLKNLEKNSTSDGQNFSGVRVVIDGPSGTGNHASTSTGNISTINTSDHTFTVGAANSLPRWRASHVFSVFSLSTLSGCQPRLLIIGPDDHNRFVPRVGKYTNANSSVSAHDPVVLGTATFMTTIPGVNSDTTVRDFQFSFGTDPVFRDANIVPEPASVAMVSASLPRCYSSADGGPTERK